MVSLKGTKHSAVCQAVIGCFCIIFGTVDRIFIYTNKDGKHVYYTEGVIAIWMGAWFVITGVFGYFMARTQESKDRTTKACINAYCGFSILATVFALTLLICYSIGLSDLVRGSSCFDNQSCRTSFALAAIIIIIGAVEFGVGIWACNSSCTDYCFKLCLECLCCCNCFCCCCCCNDGCDDCVKDCCTCN